MDNNREIFRRNLAYYIERSGKGKKTIADDLGFALSTFSEWTKGKKYPRMDKIEMLANYFGILKSDLIEDKSDEHREMQIMNDIISDIVIRMQSDEVFASAVEALHKADEKKLLSILHLLD